MGEHDDPHTPLSPARERRLAGLLRRAEKNPSSVLDDRRCRKPDFCGMYLDLCDDKVLRANTEALPYATVGLELALLTGDKHLVSRSLGVLVHAHVGREEPVAAQNVLDGYRAQALSCCESCRSDWWRRQGDLYAELRDPIPARHHLESALRHCDGDPDTVGRIRFLLGIPHYHLGDPAGALESEFAALRQIVLHPSRKGYLRDATILVAIALRGTGSVYDAWVLGELKRFKERLLGVVHWTDVHVYLRWVLGVLDARRGDFKGAAGRLERVRAQLPKIGPPETWAAVTLDLAQIYSRSRGESTTVVQAIEPMLSKCLRSPLRKLRPDLYEGLKELRHVLHRSTEKTFDAAVALRSSFVSPVPGLLADCGGRSSRR